MHIEALHLPHIELQGRQLEKSKICMGGEEIFSKKQGRMR